MALTQQAAAAGLTAPAALVLLSPWLDLTMTDPAQVALEKVDPLLSRAGPEAAGRWYAGAWPTADPRVSPMFGDIAALPQTLLFCGTHDILLADARRFAALAERRAYPSSITRRKGSFTPIRCCSSRSRARRRTASCIS